MNDAQFQNTVLPHLHRAADDISKVLLAQFPPADHQELTVVPADGVEAIAWALTEVVADVLQSYINAGSESDAIHESLGQHMEAEVRDWSEVADVH